MDMNQILQMLAQMGAKPQQGVSAPNAMQNIGARKAYTDYYIQASSSGEQPLPFEQWVQQQQSQQGMMQQYRK